MIHCIIRPLSNAKSLRRDFASHGFFSIQSPTMDHSTLPPEADGFGRVGIPTEFKLLSVLRILGRGMHFDDAAEYVGCGFKGEALRVFFHAWVRKFHTLDELVVRSIRAVWKQLVRACPKHSTLGQSNCFGLANGSCGVGGFYVRCLRSIRRGNEPIALTPRTVRVHLTTSKFVALEAFDVSLN
jgi:hypothetical protein